MAGSGLLADTHSLLALRVITGASSAAIFISGGVLAARLASSRPHDAGLVLGLYYGGTGWGIVASSVLVPLTMLNVGSRLAVCVVRIGGRVRRVSLRSRSARRAKSM